MDKIWIIKGDGDDKILAIGNKRILKVKPQPDKFEQYVRDLQCDSVSKDVLSIPYSYIKNIQYQEGKELIKIFFGQDSEEHLRIKDKYMLVEIFKYFKENIPHTEYSFRKYSAIKSGKKPLIAVLITIILFAWTLYIAIQIEMGYQYDIVGGSGRSITGIVLVIANLGVFNVILLFSSLMSIGLFVLIRKMRNRPSVHDIVFLR